MKIKYLGDDVPDPIRVRAGKRAWRTRKRRVFFKKAFALSVPMALLFGMVTYPQPELVYIKPAGFHFVEHTKAYQEEPLSKEAPFITEGYITRWAMAYNLDPQLVYDIVACESGFDPHIASRVDTNSHGLVQINLDVHKDISLEQAHDPDFAMWFLVSHLSKGKGWMWKNCYEQANS